jgi:hypothetical protein
MAKKSKREAELRTQLQQAMASRRVANAGMWVSAGLLIGWALAFALLKTNYYAAAAFCGLALPYFLYVYVKAGKNAKALKKKLREGELE